MEEIVTFNEEDISTNGTGPIYTMESNAMRVQAFSHVEAFLGGSSGPPGAGLGNSGSRTG